MCVRECPPDDALPTIITGGKNVKEFEPDFFLVSLAHGQPGHDRGYNILKVYEVPSSFGELNGYLKKYKGMPTHHSFANFGLLLYLSQVMDIHTALGIATDVASEKAIQPFTMELIEARAN